MMAHKIYIVADTHFGHSELIVKGLRPAGYEDKIIKNTSFLMLDAADMIYHLGDVSVAESSEQEAEFNRLFTHSSAAKFVLIRGNHDRRSTGWYLDKGWSAVLDAALLNMYGHNILLSHEPQPPDDWWTVNIHGHLHDSLHRNEEFPFLGERNVLYSCEKFHYQPMPLKSLLKGAR